MGSGTKHRGRGRWRLAMIGVFVLSPLGMGIAASDEPPIDLSTAAGRAQAVAMFQARHDADMAAMQANFSGLATHYLFGTANVGSFARMESGRPIFHSVLNNARYGIAVGVNTVRDLPPNLTATGITAGIWDGGAVRITHQEYGGRITVADGSNPLMTPDIYHSTAVCGVIASSGAFNANSKGMAIAINMKSYDNNNDLTEIAAAAAAMSMEAGKLPLSNHSYANDAGWEAVGPKGSVPHWFGTITNPMAIPNESEEFGRYNEYAADLDAICYGAPYFLPVRAISNDRDDAAPSLGATYWYWDGTNWASAAYNGTTPRADGWDGGYDTIRADSSGKNVLSVGAVNIAESGGIRNLALATMTSFSGWGPTDDGRLKPDLVAPGVSLFSTSGTADVNYSSGGAGTSFASPAVMGGAALVLQHYTNTFGAWPRASTLKALLIHTADDLDAPILGAKPGPDYATGWGHPDIDAAIDVIDEQAASPLAPVIVQNQLETATPSLSFLIAAQAGTPIVATLVWTDPAAADTAINDDGTSRLVNDLDLRIAAPGGAVAFPYVLNPANPSLAATTGDNTRDNVEQVRIASAPTTGVYTITVSHKGALSAAEQQFGLIISGSASDADNDYAADFGEWTNAALQSPGSATRTNLWLSDSDNDGLLDGREAQPAGAFSTYPGGTTGTDPRDPDTDGDGWLDGLEVRFPATFPNGPLVADVLSDVDGDGLPDSLDSDSSLADANGDAIPDGRDSDGDGFADGYELAHGNSSTSASDYPALGDTNSSASPAVVADVTTLANWAAGLGSLPQPGNGDVDANGVVDAADATALGQWLVGPAPYQLP